MISKIPKRGDFVVLSSAYIDSTHFKDIRPDVFFPGNIVEIKDVVWFSPTLWGVDKIKYGGELIAIHEVDPTQRAFITPYDRISL